MSQRLQQCPGVMWVTGCRAGSAWGAKGEGCLKGHQQHSRALK